MLLLFLLYVQAFKAVFEVPAWRAACEGAAGGIRAILKTYKEVLDHLSEGLRFYMSLQVGANIKMESLLSSLSAAAAAFSSSCCKRGAALLYEPAGGCKVQTESKIAQCHQLCCHHSAHTHQHHGRNHCQQQQQLSPS
jgi:hypothetical protein